MQETGDVAADSTGDSLRKRELVHQRRGCHARERRPATRGWRLSAPQTRTISSGAMEVASAVPRTRPATTRRPIPTSATNRGPRSGPGASESFRTPLRLYDRRLSLRLGPPALSTPPESWAEVGLARRKVAEVFGSAAFLSRVRAAVLAVCVAGELPRRQSDLSRVLTPIQFAEVTTASGSVAAASVRTVSPCASIGRPRFCNIV